MKHLITLFFISFFGIITAQNDISFDKAKAYYDAGEHIKARETLNALIETGNKEQNRSRNWFLRASIYIALLHETVLDTDRNTIIEAIAESIHKTKALESETTAYYKLITQKQQSLWADEINAGTEAKRNDDYEKAYTYYKNALLLKPESPEANLYLAYTAQKLEAYDEAAAAYEKLVAANKIDDISYTLYLSCQRSRGATLEQMEELIDIGLDNFPDSKIIQQQKIKSLDRQQEFEALETLLKSYVAKYPNDPSYDFQLALYYDNSYIRNLNQGNSLVAEDNYIKAKTGYEKVLTHEKTRYLANYNLSSLLSYKANSYSRLLDEMDPETYQSQSTDLLSKREHLYKEAITYMLVANDLNPNDINVLTNLKNLYKQLKDDKNVTLYANKIKLLKQ